MQDKITSVAIVGAGIAGLSCARVLQEQGLKVQVFESAAEVGGRMSSLSGLSWQCDHGAQYFTAKGAQFCEELVRWEAAGVAECWNPRMRAIDEVRGPWRESGSNTKRYVGVPSMMAPAQFLAQSLSVQLQAHVDGLQKKSRGWQLHIMGEGWQSNFFDAVVLALPAPHAQALLQQTTSAFQDLLSAVQMRPAWAVIVCCDESFDPGFDAAFINTGPIRWVARNLSKPQRKGENLWILQANAQCSAAHGEAKPNEVASLLINAFQEICAVGFRTIAVHYWPCADIDSSLERDFLWDADLKLGLCGDWLFDAKIEGAWWSGFSLAKVIAHESKEKQLDIKLISFEFGSLEYELALELRNQILRIPLGRSLDSSDLEGENSQIHFGVLNLGNELIACVSVKIQDGKHYKIRQMAVADNFQGKGFGAKLVQYVERELSNKGVTKISLHARETAISFYEKLGFQCSGELFDEVGIPHIKMLKKMHKNFPED